MAAALPQSGRAAGAGLAVAAGGRRPAAGAAPCRPRSRATAVDLESACRRGCQAIAGRQAVGHEASSSSSGRRPTRARAAAAPPTVARPARLQRRPRLPSTRATPPQCSVGRVGACRGGPAPPRPHLRFAQGRRSSEDSPKPLEAAPHACRGRRGRRRLPAAADAGHSSAAQVALVPTPCPPRRPPHCARCCPLSLHAPRAAPQSPQRRPTPAPAAAQPRRSPPRQAQCS